MTMRILLIVQYFPPETGGTPNRLSSLALGLKNAGHEVTVIAEKPSHPEGTIWPKFRGGLFVHREHQGIPVIYTWVYARPKKTSLPRILNYLSFMVMAVAAAWRVPGRIDFVLASSPSLFVGVSGWLTSIWKRARLILDVRDLWPDAAVVMGELRHPLLIAAASALERFLYQHSTGIIATTESFCATIRERISHSVPVESVRDCTVPEDFVMEPCTPQFRDQWQFAGKFIVGYIGNVGLAQGLDHLLDAAKALQTAIPEVAIVVAGDGPRKNLLMAEAARRDLANIRFLPRVDQQRAAQYMIACDALVVTLDAHPLFKKWVPSKLFDCLAAGRPILMGADGEARRLLEAEQAGLVYSCGDGRALAEAVLWLYNHPAEASSMGNRGQIAARMKYSRICQTQRIVALLEKWHRPVLLN